ncbi:MAG: hypothetical protein ACO1SV_27515 [Fimbriimonas sp.]
MTAHDRRLQRIMRAASAATTAAEAFQCVRDAYMLGLELAEEVAAEPEAPFTATEKDCHCDGCKLLDGEGLACKGRTYRAFDPKGLGTFIDKRRATATGLMIEEMRR